MIRLEKLDDFFDDLTIVYKQEHNILTNCILSLKQTLLIIHLR